MSLNNKPSVDVSAIDHAIDVCSSARSTLDNFIGERECYECIGDDYLVGRVTAADVLLREAIKELEREKLLVLTSEPLSE